MRIRLLLCILLFSVPYLASAQVAAVGDLNGDGKPDVVVSDPIQNRVGIFLNTGNGSLGTGVFLGVGSSPRSVSLADFNGDGHLDILAVTSPKLQILFGDGKGGFAAPVVIPQSGIPTIGSSVVGDFNGDGFADIAFAYSNPIPTVAVLFGDGKGGFSLSAPHLIAIDPSLHNALAGLVVVDANNDGLPDLVINMSLVPSSSLQAFLAINDGKGGFVSSQLAPGGNVQAFGDFNGDGNLDFVVQAILFGDGQGGVLYAPTRRTCFDLPAPALFGVDFDHNLTTDVVGNENFFPGNGHGGFGDSISITSFPLNTLAVADFNADGRPDLVTFTPGPVVSIQLNNTATPVSISASTNTTNPASVFNTNTGQTITLTSFTNSFCGIPTGSVTFKDGATTLGSVPVNIYGAASLDTTFTTGGTHNISATFTGTLDPATNTIYGDSAGPNFAVSANNAPPTAPAPTLALSVSANPARELNPITLTASITSPNGPATGLVTFRADNDVLGVVPLPNAQLTVAFPPGLHNLQASFGGDGNFPPATSNTLVEDVRALTAVRTASSVQLTVTPASTASASQSITLTAALSGVPNPPANFIYRLDGAFIGSSSQPVSFLPPSVGTFAVSAEYTGDAELLPGTSSKTLVVGNPVGDFIIDASPASATIKAGQTATFTITVSPVNGLNSAITFACSGLPAASSCNFSPASLTPGGSPVSTTLTITTTAPSAAAAPISRLNPWTFAAWPVAMVLGLFLVSIGNRSKKVWRWSLAFGATALAFCLVSCGGGNSTPPNNPGTPPGTSSITVTATSGTSHSAALSVTVTP
jgi:VCBS repeat protein/Big-like domain-containing protein/FG-GAP repeat protein